MGLEEEAAWIRAQVGAIVGRRGRGNPYPDEVRRRAIGYFHARRKQRISPAKICLELGIGMATLRSWTSPNKVQRVATNSGFERLAVIDVPASEPKKQFVVRGPRGLYIEGLDIDALAELIRRLS